jgi:hypothetical protein
MERTVSMRAADAICKRAHLQLDECKGNLMEERVGVPNVNRRYTEGVDGE